MYITDQIVAPQQLTGVAAPYYESLANLRTLIKKLTFGNDTGGAVLVTVYVVPTGGAAAAANKIVKRTVMDGETWECTELENHILKPGDKLYALGLNVVIMATGMKIPV